MSLLAIITYTLIGVGYVATTDHLTGKKSRWWEIICATAMWPLAIGEILAHYTEDLRR